MRVRDSGMPEEAVWASFFDAGAAMEALLGTEGVNGDLVEFGCGYGTFTIPAALRTRGIVTALDIDPEMLDCLRQKANELRLPNILCELRDFIARGTGLQEGT
jgi:predicted RNA methylase